MLSKLLKYEFKATGRILLPVFGAFILAGALLGLGFLAIDYGDMGGFFGAATGIFTLVYILAIFCVGTATMVVLIYRFHKNLLSNEGYLSFTLPATVHQQIWAKLIPAIVWTLVAAIAVILSLTLVAVIVPTGRDLLSELYYAFQNMFETIEMYLSISSGEIAAIVLEVLLLALLSVICTYLMGYGALAFGCSFSKRRVVATIATLLVLALLMQLLSTAFTNVIMNLLGAAGNETNVISVPGITITTSGVTPLFFDYIHVVLLSLCALEVLLGVGLYCLTAYSLKSRLNLA